MDSQISYSQNKQYIGFRIFNIILYPTNLSDLIYTGLKANLYIQQKLLDRSFISKKAFQTKGFFCALFSVFQHDPAGPVHLSFRFWIFVSKLIPIGCGWQSFTK